MPPQAILDHLRAEIYYLEAEITEIRLQLGENRIESNSLRRARLQSIISIHNN